MRKASVIIASAATAGAFIGSGVVAVAASSPNPDVVTRVTGTASDGYHFRFADGRQTWEPTRSESLAECGSYHLRVERVACRAATRTMYRDWHVLKVSLRYARNH